MNDNIDKDEIRRAIDRLQTEHPCGIAYDPTAFVNMEAVNTIKECVDKIARRMMEDTEINIICEFAKLYLEGARPMVIQKQGWIPCSERLPHAEYGESNSVLCQLENDTMKVLYWNGGNWCYPTGELYHSVNHKNGWHNRVIAWMPLPEPCEEGDSDAKC